MQRERRRWIQGSYRVGAVEFYQFKLGSEEGKRGDSCACSNWAGNAGDDHRDIAGSAGLILENGELHEFEVFLSRQELEVHVKNLRVAT